MRATKRILLVVVCGLVALVVVAVATAADTPDKVVFTVGVTNDPDTFNPLVGVEVPDYEVWNLQYATLTDKAADDFATIPGLAESWVARTAARRTRTRSARPEVVGRHAADVGGRRLHDQPLA